MSNDVRLEGLTLSVADIQRSLDFYSGKLGFDVEILNPPHFAMIRVGGPLGGTIGLLTADQPMDREAIRDARAQIHVECSVDDLDALYASLVAKGVAFAEPPHDEPWERSMSALDPDGYTVEFAQGRRGKNAPG